MMLLLSKIPKEYIVQIFLFVIVVPINFFVGFCAGKNIPKGKKISHLTDEELKKISAIIDEEITRRTVFDEFNKK